MLSGTAENARLPFHIAVFPPGVTQQGNPYFSLCHAALRTHGISAADDLEIDPRWLEARAGSVDAVHLHWPERFWGRAPFGGLSRIRRAAVAGERLLELVRFIRTARRLGMTSIWTVHNMEPHEGSYRWDRYGYRLLARECDLVICHSRSAADAVRRTYRPRGRLVVMPIGNPAVVHPSPRPREEVMAELRLDPRRPAVSCCGLLRAYKGLDVACGAIERLNGNVQIIVGGRRHADFDAAPLRSAIARLEGAVLIERELTDQELADLTAASDAVLLPYRAITGSSALLAALGFGRGVVASDLPYFREILADEPDAGAIVSGWGAAEWADAILRYLERPADARNAAALRLAARYSWDRCVEPLVAALGVRRTAGVAGMQEAGAAC